MLQIHFEFACFYFVLIHLELKRQIRSYTPQPRPQGAFPKAREKRPGTRLYTPVVPSKTMPDSRPKWAKYIPVLIPNRRKKPYSIAYMREYPSPPPPTPPWTSPLEARGVSVKRTYSNHVMWHTSRMTSLSVRGRLKEAIRSLEKCFVPPLYLKLSVNRFR